MNILGKILVFLNLLFALAVAGFLLIDFQTRVNWKDKFIELEREFKVAQTNSKTVVGTTVNSKVEVAKLQQQLVTEQDKHKEAVAKANDAYEAEKVKTLKEKAIAIDSIANYKAAKAHIETLNLQKTKLAEQLVSRDKLILSLEEKADKAVKDVQQANNDRLTLLNRVDELQKQLSALTIKMNTDLVVKEGVKLKDKNSPNPPPFFIKGKVVKVDSDDATLVLLSLGKDQGLEVGHTLEAYRKLPQAKYLGMVRIVELTNHNAVARLVPTPYAPPVALHKDDEVASQILPGY